jgi:DNA-binding response OmpR family regulator
MIVDDGHDIANQFKIFLEYDGYNVDAVDVYTNPIDALTT